MKRLFFLIIAMVIGILSLRAQGAGRPGKERMKAAKIGFITSRLHLTAEEAKQFWPVYDSFEKEKNSLQKERKLSGFTSDLYKEEMREKEAEVALQKMISLQERQLEIQKKYQAEFLKVLPATKVISLMQAEKTFHHLQLQKRKEGGTQPKPAPESSPSPRD